MDPQELFFWGGANIFVSGQSPTRPERGSVCQESTPSPSEAHITCECKSKRKYTACAPWGPINLGQSCKMNKQVFSHFHRGNACSAELNQMRGYVSYINQLTLNLRSKL